MHVQEGTRQYPQRYHGRRPTRPRKHELVCRKLPPVMKGMGGQGVGARDHHATTHQVARSTEGNHTNSTQKELLAPPPHQIQGSCMGSKQGAPGRRHNTGNSPRLNPEPTRPTENQCCRTRRASGILSSNSICLHSPTHTREELWLNLPAPQLKAQGKEVLQWKGKKPLIKMASTAAHFHPIYMLASRGGTGGRKSTDLSPPPPVKCRWV